MARAVEDAGGNVLRPDALVLGEPADRLFRPHIEIDKPRRMPGTDRNLLHVDVGHVEQAIPPRDRNRGKRILQVFCADRMAVERVCGDVHLRPFARPYRFAHQELAAVPTLGRPNHDPAAYVQVTQLVPHGINRRLIGKLLVAAPAVGCRCDRRSLGGAHQLERQNAIHHAIVRLAHCTTRH